MSKITLGVSLAAKLEQALERNDITDLADIDWLASGDNIAKVRQVRLATITAIEHMIDCDADPFVPNGWTVEEHQKGGMFKWNKEAQKDALYYSKKQKKGVIGGNDLRKELAKQPVLNANVLDFLLANPCLIPKEWKHKGIFFWGTVYRDSGGDLCVRYLCWGGGKWRWGSGWLDDDWIAVSPALVRAS